MKLIGFALIVSMLTPGFAGFPREESGKQSQTGASNQSQAEQPAPYRQEEVSFANGNVTLAGTLTLPAGSRPAPAVLLITGSGSQNRDEEAFGFKPFRLIADHLTRRGIAVLRYDDRGVGGSTGSVPNSTSLDFAADVLAAVKMLRSRPEIDKDHIGLLGHSEGGLVAPIAAAQSPDISFIILMSGPGVAGEKILLAQGRAIAGANGASEADLAEQEAFQLRTFKAVREGSGWEDLRAELQRKGEKQLAELTPEQKKNIPDPAAYLKSAIDAQLKPSQTVWFKCFLDLDPAPYLEKVKCPVLATFGELDLQVPAEMNRRAIVAALAKGGNNDITVQTFPKANHMYLSAVKGTPREYTSLPKEFVPGFLDLIANWISAKTRLERQ